MKVERISEGKTLTLIVDGRIDTIESQEFAKEFDNLDSIDELIIDLAKVDYVSSAALRVLLSVRNKMKDKTIKLRNVSDLVREILELTRFIDLFVIE